MSITANPGSGAVPPYGTGWTNTYATAKTQAEKWLAQMRAEAMNDVELLDTVDEENCRWRFTFRHRVTGTCVHLDIDVVDDIEAYKRENLFSPRIYWNGDSSANPKLEDFAAEGFEQLRTFRRKHAPED